MSRTSKSYILKGGVPLGKMARWHVTVLIAETQDHNYLNYLNQKS